MTDITTYANAALAALKNFLQWARRTGVWKLAAGAAAGFIFSAASLLDRATPIALGLLCAAPPGLTAVCIAVGAGLGYLVFWGEAQCAAWMAAGLAVAMLAGDKPISQRQKLLLPACAALVVSGSGVVFLLLRLDNTAIPIYLLRVVLGAGVTGVFQRWRTEPGGIAGWLMKGLVTLALAQIAPARYLNLGCIAAGFYAIRCSFPGAVMAGLGLDLAGVTAVPMAGVLCLVFCLRLIPAVNKRAGWLAPAGVFLTASFLWGSYDIFPLPGLMIGGLLGQFLPGNTLPPVSLQKKGVVGLAQVRLEKTALILERMERTLMLPLDPEPDRRGLLRQAADCACDACPERRGCKARHLIPGLPLNLLEQPGLQTGDLPPGCRKNGRLLNELRRSQEQLRRIKGERSRLNDCRTALRDQYDFLARYLRWVSDSLAVTQPGPAPRLRPEVGISSRSLEGISGDLCLQFQGAGEKSYVLLCDGMGTGDAAAVQSREAAALVRQFLEAGFAPGDALRSFNSLSLLRGAGGFATVDLLEMDLHSGKCILYKWGAAPSYLLRGGQLRKIGTASAPPGLSQLARETTDRLSLGEGDVLIMLSDGAGEEALLHPRWTAPDASPGEMAAAILEQGVQRGDDATVAVVQLVPV